MLNLFQYPLVFMGLRIKSAMIMTALTIMFILAGCEESKRFEISGNDTTPPGVPVFVESKPLPGGASIFFIPPVDHDVLYIEASYVNVVGNTLRFAASFAADSLVVYGFDKEGNHQIELYAVDRAGNRSTSVRQTVVALEPFAVAVAKSLDVLPSFSSMLLKWENGSMEPLYVWTDLAYTQNGVHREHTTVFNTYQTEIRTISGLNLFNDEPISVKVSVRDKYDNVVQAKDTSIVLLVDEVLSKNGWILPDADVEMGGITQVNGLRLNTLLDDVIDIDAENFFVTFQNNPWNIIIDLGETYEISRIVTHQRWSGFNTSAGAVDVQGNLYRGLNVMAFNLYGWDETDMSWEFWSRHTINRPVVNTEGEYTILGKEGDMTFVFPEKPQFSKPTRFFRFEAINGKYISEITLYGRKSQ